MKPKLKYIVAASLVMSLYSYTTQALMPPMTPEELAASANTIVHGTVIKVSTTGPKNKNECRIDIPQQATLTVDKKIKGNAPATLSIQFNKTEFINLCLGSPDHVHTEGEKGTFYLNCDTQNICHLVHWNGIIPD